MPEGYTENEQEHMVDVKQVMQKADILFFVLLLITTLILTYYKRQKQQIRELLKKGGWVTIGFTGTVLLLSLVAFNWAFSYFHKIFFPQGNWQFPVDSLLLQTWPLDFFISTSAQILILTIIIGIITIYISKKYIK